MKVEEILPFFDHSQAELARALNVQRQVVQNWKRAGKIPDAPMLKLKYELLPEAIKKIN